MAIPQWKIKVPPMTITIVTVVGARPQFIKAAAFSRAVAETEGLEEVLVHTGQHYDADMSDVFFRELAIPAPHRHLEIAGGSHGEMTGRMLAALEPVIASQTPDAVLVYGDTNSTLAGALAAAKLAIPVAHVEAGLRSFLEFQPEEINRRLTDHASRLLFCPTGRAVENLMREGISRGVHQVGDVMFDAACFAAARSEAQSTILDRLGLQRGGYQVATVHRAENTDDRDRLAAVLDHLRAAAEEAPVVLPLHPRTRAAAARHGLEFSGLTVTDPIGYLDMTRLLANAIRLHTDSGGLQKEAYFHRVPCVTLREVTEWVETVACGWNRLWTVDRYAPRRDIAEYGDGQAAERIIDVILAEFAK